METRAITEGAVMAALTAVLAMTGVYFPVLSPVIMLVWTLPVVVVCLRRGMRAGALTMAVAGLMIMIVATPVDGLYMLMRSAAPALLIGRGFHRKWRAEKTVLFTTLAAFISLLASLAISVFVMGVSLEEMFTLSPDMVDEIVVMFGDYGLLTSWNMSAGEATAYITSMFESVYQLIPAILIMTSLLSACTNYLASHVLLGRLKMPLPPMINLAAFRLPFGLVFVLILGVGLMVVGANFLPQYPSLVTIGQNITYSTLSLYFIQGLGLVFFLIKTAPQDTRKFWRFGFILVFVIFFFQLLSILGYMGVVDALFDFRKLTTYPEQK